MNKIIILNVALFFALLVIPISFATETSLTYDTNGNLVSGDGFYREYNSLNQLSTIYEGDSSSGKLLEALTYHPTEDRVWIKKVYSGSADLIETVHYVNKNIIKVVNSSGTFTTRYIYQDDELVSEIKPDGSKLFYHNDNLGSSSIITEWGWTRWSYWGDWNCGILYRIRGWKSS